MAESVEHRYAEHDGVGIDVWVHVEPKGYWEFQIGAGGPRRKSGPYPLSNAEGMFREALDVAKGTIDRANKLPSGSRNWPKE